jgi:UDP-3-O-[3-hydroxymyristoyl] N-acetylglucosamine deacetylase/3-hydroxyacyl-[acyl-carrier-protein] dehydratase
VRPGDQLRIHAKLTKVRNNKIALATVTCTVDGQVVSSADVMITIVDEADLD